MGVLVSVELSPVVGGLVRTWSDEGSQLWQVRDGDLQDVVGRGQLARTEVEPQRFREVGLLEQPTSPAGAGRLWLLSRWQSERPAVPGEIATVGEVIDLAPVAAPDIAPPRSADELWAAFVEHLGDLCVAAAGRGEVLLLERGAIVHEPWPYALFAVIEEDGGSWTSHLEVSPPPEPVTPYWDEAARGRNGDGTDGASMSATAAYETVSSAGFLLGAAASGWAATPQDLAMTFAAAPTGAVELRPGAPPRRPTAEATD